MSATAETLIHDLAAQGVHLSPNGDKLHVKAPAGILTAELREKLTARKPELMAVLRAEVAPSAASGLAPMRVRLASLANTEGVDTDLVHRLADDDVAACAGLSSETLRCYVLMLRDSELRELGQCPPDETATILCRHCGVVFAHPAVAAVLPVVRGMPTALGCPWCHVKNRQTMPRPKNVPPSPGAINSPLHQSRITP